MPREVNRPLEVLQQLHRWQSDCLRIMESSKTPGTATLELLNNIRLKSDAMYRGNYRELLGAEKEFLKLTTDTGDQP